MEKKAGDAGRRALRLLKNSLILYFLLFLCNSIEPYLHPFLDLRIGSIRLSSETVFTGLSLIFLIYFGYFILLDVKFFLGLASKLISAWLVGEEVSRVRMIAYDIAIIIALILFYELVTPLVSGIQGVGKPLATAIQIVVLAIVLLLLYHLATQIYHLVRDRAEILMRKIMRRISGSDGDDED